MSSEYKRVRDYELMVIFHPELSEEDLASEISKVEGHITTAEGSITLVNRESPWGRRRLAYPVRHDSRDIRDGFYVLYYFTSESGRLAEMEREIKLQDRILRYLLTQQTAPIMEPEPEVEESAEGESDEAAEAAPTSADAGAAPAADTTEDAPAAEVAAAEEVAAESVDAAPTDEIVAEAADEAPVGETEVDEGVAVETATTEEA